MGNKTKPFDDVRVRRAVLLALDKAQLAQFAVFGHGMPTHSPISPRHPYFNKQLSLKPDVAQAKKLLAEAGYPNGFTDHPARAGRPADARADGRSRSSTCSSRSDIQVDVVRMPYNRFQTEVSGKSPFYMDGYFTRPTLDTSTYPWYHTSGSWNTRMWHFSSPRIDAMLDKARGTERREGAVQDLPDLPAVRGGGRAGRDRLRHELRQRLPQEREGLQDALLPLARPPQHDGGSWICACSYTLKRLAYVAVHPDGDVGADLLGDAGHARRRGADDRRPVRHRRADPRGARQAAAGRSAATCSTCAGRARCCRATSACR